MKITGGGNKGRMTEVRSQKTEVRSPKLAVINWKAKIRSSGNLNMSPTMFEQIAVVCFYFRLRTSDFRLQFKKSNDQL